MSDSMLYLYTSLTAGSSHIVTATARLETILKANRLPFRAIDVATDDAARKLWGRRSKGKKLPGLVKFGNVVGDLEQIEEWNEYGELKMQINSVVDDFDSMPATSTPDKTSSAPAPQPEPTVPKQSTIKIQNPPAKEPQKDDSITVALRQAGEQAAAKAKENAQAETKKPSSPAVVGQTSDVAAAAVAPNEKKNGESGQDTVAAMSSANFHADNAEALGLIEHHRGSNIAAESKEEAEKLALELRKSISGDRQGPTNSLQDNPITSVRPEEATGER
ncbi:hypothetical protein ARAM_000504 [Aspergillus rambellii]|uniref:Uncharacterized protein n=1 Tax=Aspergillus rambellii TaxID=308745 RepID=A0A0F8UA90_9EURO|nr:hypothetical protein ARAM_000504 [Aspergillus rambellii]